MNVKVEVDAKTLAEVTKQLKEALVKDEEAAFQGMLDTGYEIRDAAVEKCTVDQGLLRSNIGVEGDKRKKEVRIGTNVKYAPFVEFGTRPHTPPIAPIKEWADRKGIANVGAVWAAIRKHGTKPHPFLRPAFAEKIVNLVKNIMEEMPK